MKEEIKNKWVKALRSGEYAQGTGCLVEDGRFCCLGVLCDISETNKREWGSFAGLPHSVKDWAGMSSIFGHFGISTCLSELNDSGKTFIDIADVIEKEWEKL